MSVHAPGDGCIIALSPEGELGRVCGGEWSQKIEFDPDELIRLALSNGHAAGTDFVVSFPGIDRSRSCGRALDRLFHGRIQLCPGRPFVPIMEIIHLSEN